MELYDFYADWCGMCQTMIPIIDAFCKLHPEINLIKVNVDMDEKLSEKYKIEHLPSFLFVKKDKVLYKCNRMLSLDELESIYKKVIKKC